MKTLQYILFLSLIALLLASCGGAPQKSTTANDTNTPAAEVDMTTMSKTMVYSEINFMRSNPERYMGKTIRVEGIMEYNPLLHRRYCVIADATACCSVQLEFVLKGDHSHPFLNALDSQNMQLPGANEITPQPDPQNGSKIVIQGYFQTFQEREKQSVILTDALYCH